MFPKDGQTRKRCFSAMFPKGGQTKKHCLHIVSWSCFPKVDKPRNIVYTLFPGHVSQRWTNQETLFTHCFLAMFPKGGQTRKHCLHIVSWSCFPKVDKPGNIVYTLLSSHVSQRWTNQETLFTHCFLAMFPKGGQTRKHCLHIVSWSCFPKVDKPGNIVYTLLSSHVSQRWTNQETLFTHCFLAMFPKPCFPKVDKPGNIVYTLFPGHVSQRWTNQETLFTHCFLAMFPEGGQTRKHCFL